MSLRHGIIASLLLIAVAHGATAQRTTGAIIGTVADESGAVLPGVTVELQGAGAAGSPTTTTSPTGAYRFPALSPGSYDLTYTLAGFKAVRMTGIVVSVGNTAEMNVVLAVG